MVNPVKAVLIDGWSKTIITIVAVLIPTLIAFFVGYGRLQGELKAHTDETARIVISMQATISRIDMEMQSKASRQEVADMLGQLNQRLADLRADFRTGYLRRSQ